MPLKLSRSKTVPGRLFFIVGGECEWHQFPDRAWAVTDTLQLTLLDRTDRLSDTRIWLVGRGEAIYCLSWDHWFNELSLMAWQNTPDAALEQLCGPLADYDPAPGKPSDAI